VATDKKRTLVGKIQLREASQPCAYHETGDFSFFKDFLEKVIYLKI
jgi:hypothetical protein